MSYLPMWNRGPRVANPITYEKGQHRHDELPGMCGAATCGRFSHVFVAQNAFNVKAPTAMQEEWIKTKRKFPNSIILVKIGKFYELFHKDADIFVSNVDRMCYMSGKIAHTGFPENKLSAFINLMNSKGYSEIKII